MTTDYNPVKVFNYESLGPTQCKTAPLKCVSDEKNVPGQRQPLLEGIYAMSDSALDAIDCLPAMEEWSENPSIAEMNKAIDSCFCCSTLAVLVVRGEVGHGYGDLLCILFSFLSSLFSKCVLYHQSANPYIFYCCSSFSSYSFQMSFNPVHSVFLPSFAISHSCHVSFDNLSSPILSICPLTICHLPFLPRVV